MSRRPTLVGQCQGEGAGGQGSGSEVQTEEYGRREGLRGRIKDLPQRETLVERIRDYPRYGRGVQVRGPSRDGRGHL